MDYRRIIETSYSLACYSFELNAQVTRSLAWISLEVVKELSRWTITILSEHLFLKINDVSWPELSQTQQHLSEHQMNGHGIGYKRYFIHRNPFILDSLWTNVRIIKTNYSRDNVPTIQGGDSNSTRWDAGARGPSNGFQCLLLYLFALPLLDDQSDPLASH